MNRKVIVFFILGIIFIGIIFILMKNPGRLSQPVQRGKLRVVTSFYPLYFFSRQIGGDRATVVNITPAGAEPHDYEPTPRDIAQIEGSRLLILNGGGLEAWGDRIRQNVDPKKTTIVVAGQGLTGQPVTEGGQTRADPHVWLDPVLAQKMVDHIARGFIEVDPAHKDVYERNAAALKSKLSKVDAAYRQGLGDCREKNIITSHAAFGYLAARYGLKQVSIAGLSPDAEPSIQKLANIVRFARAHQVKYIFFESLVSPKLSQTIAAEVGARTLVLNPVAGLSDQELAQGQTYFTEMEKNLVNLRKALQCR
jgi:zinc transport system substrate-binding protein